jgi:G3E family GTPase
LTTRFNLITGFLGSGKTSLLRHLLDGTWDKGRVGVVVGEFAQQGYDAGRLQHGDHDVVMVVGTGYEQGPRELLDRVRIMLDTRHYDRILLETSGVVDATRLVRTLRADHELAERVSFGRTVTCIDAEAFASHQEHFGELMAALVAIADLVAVNRIERVPEEQREAIRAWVRGVNPDAVIELCYMGQIRKSLFYKPFEEGVRARLFDAPPVPESLRDFEWFLYESDLICYDRVMFGHRLLNLPLQIARFKGVLCCHDTMWGLNGLPGQLDWDPVDDTFMAGSNWRGVASNWGAEQGAPTDGRSHPPTRIVLIGLGLDEDHLCWALDDELEKQQTHPR